MRTMLAGAALAAALVVPGVVRADAPATSEAAPNTGNLSLSGGADYVTEYYFRGQKQSPAGFIVQPYVQLNVAAYKSDNFSITPYVGTWNDVQTNTDYSVDGAKGPSKRWWESDVFAGITWGLPQNFKIDTIYTLYSSPDDAFKTVGEVGVKLSYDDTVLMKDKVPFTLQPYAAWYWQTFNDGALANGSTGVAQYAELGLTPTLPIGETGLTATFPIAIGLSPDGYYVDSSGKNETFGFWSAGAYLSYPLPISAKWGVWTLTAGASYVNSEAHSAKLAAYDAATENSDAIIGKISLTFAY